MNRAFALLAALTACVSYHAPAIEGADGSLATLRGTPIHFVDEAPEGGVRAGTVVLVHGFASSIGVWTGVRRALVDAGHRVIALDLKGFGHSGRPAGDYSPAEHARIVFALMDQLGVRSASLVAHSYGSSVALRVALEAPDRVRSIALYDAWVYAEQLPTSFHWARGRGVGEAIFGAFYGERVEDKVALAFFDPEAIPQALIDTTEAQIARPGTRAAALATVRAMRYEEQQAHYGEIEQPVLLIWGREDSVTPLRYGEELHRTLPESELEVYGRCGHFPMIEASAPSTRRLLRFLANADGDTDAPVNRAEPETVAWPPAAPPSAAPDEDAEALPAEGSPQP
ncbi:MAG: alpha/beta fold hydrolase [Myxococcota bacterium]